ncbi:MAG: 23S rRNA (pseudouridine(1915)-N(3))-methyltransferase RlmH [Rhodospirillales bacterium]|nr:23S rRNA (pseudouridine(1915)-N(3))-methyltransferase RlmH [Rhodospirillales bacterium]MDP6774061.1 23S rRNA (pseudouridine(1915)-N(3))-methyltransferase RlmH [Rhodospirillales bacterium]
MKRRREGSRRAAGATPRLLVAAVGRAGRAGAHEVALFDHYAARISFPLVVKEVTSRRALAAPDAVRHEGGLLLKAVPDGAVVVALDAAGKRLTSAAFAKRLGAWRDGGVKDVAFLIGGADGLDGAVTGAAELVLSLGAMTWPHLLARAMLAEQIYRAQCILSGHPYHRG